MLDRAIAERGRFPAIDILRSVSRTMPDCNSDAESELIGRARSLIATYEDMADLIRLGAYSAGSDPKVDQAIHYHELLEEFLQQPMSEHAKFGDGFERLLSILGSERT